MFSLAEKDRRHKAAAAYMEKAGLGALYIPGNSTVGTNAFGYYRYFTDNRVVFSLSNLVLFKNGDAVSVVSNAMGKYNLVTNSFIGDAVINTDQLGGIIEILKLRGINSGRVGTLPEVLPASWLIRLEKELPGVDFVDVSKELFSIRAAKSTEEAGAQRICAGIADAGFNAICDTVKPGMYENEILAEMDRAMQRLGSEESFALISSGKFSIENNGMPTLHNWTALNRKIEKGDAVALEITPRYYGYWAQIVRTICVGEINADVETLRSLVVGAIDEAKKIMKAGVPISAIVRKMREYTEDAGYGFDMPCGHIAAVDLNEERLTEDNSRELETNMLIILHPTVAAGSMRSNIYWGESYIITDGGFEETTKTGSGLYISNL